ncbi:helix-turn-helix transcriptional regulator [Francisellaceae bacterium]|nr:helix-turn-helix transcriptional regulator [Francisellaceae bacterium]
MQQVSVNNNAVSQNSNNKPSLKKYKFNKTIPHYISAYSVSISKQAFRNIGSEVVKATIHSDELLEDKNQSAFIKKTTIKRSCSDCEIQIDAYVKEKFFNPELDVSPNDETAILNFCYQFVEENLDFYIENLQGFSQLQFVNDDEYRKNVFFNGQTASENLSPKQLSVLYWSARGKTSQEVAEIMHLSNETIKCHKKQILLRLCAANIAHAIYIALQEKIIN